MKHIGPFTLILAALFVAGMVNADVEAKSVPNPPKTLALKAACVNPQVASETKVCVSHKRLASKGKKSPNITKSSSKAKKSRNSTVDDMPQLKETVFPETKVPESVTNPPQQTQVNPTPNYNFNTAYCMVICS